ncbi:serine/threonine-protein kinase [Dokdonella sp.]|uniref:serine/threonine-protein kinase n=1 Tax=Dokdonella sp. TaxID=2291710 RepID=UPI001B2F24EE|nr:serine/threonine-protein kinase [Dokdonella sp.]MBO9662945.1 protein kinase [Dokdonella sp.]
MNPTTAMWHEAHDAFDALLDLPSAEREARLAAMTLAPEVRECVRRLIDAHERGPGPLDARIGNAGGLAGRRLGAWTLDGEIGRGGMSVVHRARGDDGRVAAVKVMALGALVLSGAERFRAEQAILARLNHPHIAQLFDAGMADDGTPWFAMALVDGVQIDAWCEQRKLPPRAIVRLFTDVCEAVAHAHQNLVIHRDIKPSNVLVDVDGHVRLLDFGIARLIDGAGTAADTRWRPLTPQYAAPEQFEGAPPSTAMDVYGLGALLCRLLVGHPPHGGAKAAAAPLRRLGDLGAIVQKALAEDPRHRYATVQALADDLRRWLAGEPLAVRRPTLRYRAACFVSRHRWGVAAAAAILLALIGGLAATSWQSRRATAESARAREVQEFLVSLFDAASPETNPADPRALLARGADTARSDLADGPLKAELLLVIGSIQTRLGQFVQAHRQIDDAEAWAADPAASRSLRGRIALEQGVLAMSEARRREAIDAFDRAIALLEREPEWREKVVQAHLHRASVHEILGDLDRAFDDETRAATIEATIQPPSPRRRMNILGNLARTLFAAGRLQEADARMTEAIDLIGTPVPEDHAFFALGGDIAESLGRWDRAEASYRRALEIARAGYPAGSSMLAMPLTYLGTFLVRIGYFDEADALLRESVAVRRANDPAATTSLAMPLFNVGGLARDRGRYDEALGTLQEARRLCVEDPLGRLLISAQIVRTLAEAGRFDEAAAETSGTRDGVEEFLRGGARHPAKVARVYGWLAVAMEQAGRPEEALQLLDLETKADAAEAEVSVQVRRRAERLRVSIALGRRAEAADLDALAAEVKRLPPTGERERIDAYAALARAARAAGLETRADAFAALARQRAPGRQLPAYLERELAVLGEGTAAR